MSDPSTSTFPTSRSGGTAGNNNSVVRQYVAVRSAGELKECIFLNWEAAIPHLASISSDEVQPNIQYKVFNSLVEAEQFITGEVVVEVRSPVRRAAATTATTRLRSSTTPTSDTKSTTRKTAASKTKSPAAATAAVRGSAAAARKQKTPTRSVERKRKAAPTAADLAAAVLLNPAPTNEHLEDDVIVVVDPDTQRESAVQAPTPMDVNIGSGDSEQPTEAPAAAPAAESLLPPAESAAASAAAADTSNSTPREEEEDEPTRVARLLAAASNYKLSETWEQSYIKLAGLAVDGKLPERIDDKKLRDFYYRQLDDYRKLVKGERSSLSQEKYVKLLKIGFVFSTTPKRLIKVNKSKFDAEFEVMIAKLKEFLHKYGHCNVLKSQKEHRDLWNWMIRIRADYKRLSVPEERNKCRLTTLQMQRLTELGFCFLTVAYKPWEERLEDLKAYQAAGNDINKIPTMNHELGEFVGRCRKEYKHFLEGRRTAMTKERAQKLEDIGFDFNTHLHRDTATYPKPKTWEQRYQQLKEYYLEHGDTLVHKNHPDGLGWWVAAQRKVFKAYAGGKKSSLNPEKVGKLVEIGFIVDANVHKKKRRKVDEPRVADEDPADAGMTWHI